MPIVGGFNCIANPLDATPSNRVDYVIPAAPDGTQLLKWAGTRFSDAIQYIDVGDPELNGWYELDFATRASATVSPGEGFFINNVGGTPFNITFVGEVRQGQLSNYLATGFSLISQLTPQSGDVMSFEFPARDGDQILYWNSSSNPQRFLDAIQYIDVGDPELNGWYQLDFATRATPNVNVGQGFFVNKFTAAPWTHTFNVNTP